MGQPLALVVAAGAAILGGKVLLSRTGLFRREEDYEGLDGVVSYSSRKIAAARAMETEEASPLVADPLAAELAGVKALAAARARQQPAPPDSDRNHKVNMIAVRTKWFDDQLQASLGLPVGPAAAAGDYIVSTANGSTPRQVVMLGAGMDTRPWRLKLPADLHWYEVDRADVMQAKVEALAAAGAETGQPLTPMHRIVSFNTQLEQKIGSLDHHAAGTGAFPLRAEMWSGVAADLNEPSWVGALKSGGFDASKPTVWIAEGLLMYLAPDRVAQLLREVAAASAPGSVLLAVSITDSMLASIKARGAKSSLMATWKFGCPHDPTQWLAGCGWSVNLVTTRAKQARALGLQPEECAFDADPAAEDSTKSLFIVASVARQPA